MNAFAYQAAWPSFVAVESWSCAGTTQSLLRKVSAEATRDPCCSAALSQVPFFPLPCIAGGSDCCWNHLLSSTRAEGSLRTRAADFEWGATQEHQLLQRGCRPTPSLWIEDLGNLEAGPSLEAAQRFRDLHPWIGFRWHVALALCWNCPSVREQT